MLLSLAAQSGVVQKLTCGASVCVCGGQISEVIFGEGALGLMPAIDEWDVRSDSLTPQPVDELSAAIALVSAETLGL